MIVLKPKIGIRTARTGLFKSLSYEEIPNNASSDLSDGAFELLTSRGKKDNDNTGKNDPYTIKNFKVASDKSETENADSNTKICILPSERSERLLAKYHLDADQAYKSLGQAVQWRGDFHRPYGTAEPGYLGFCSSCRSESEIKWARSAKGKQILLCAKCDHQINFYRCWSAGFSR